MHVAFGLCERSPAVIPGKDEDDLQMARDLSVDDCLRAWVPYIDACKDESDRQWRAMEVAR